MLFIDNMELIPGNFHGDIVLYCFLLYFSGKRDATTVAVDKDQKTLMKIKEKINKLPRNSGVYIFKDKDNNYLYIGKAENIRKRVKSHFQKPGLSDKETVLTEKTALIDYIITQSAIEALILECNLIKEHKPRYNVMLRDDKKYPYIKIALDEKFPTIYITRDLTDKPARQPATKLAGNRKAGGRAKYFGPYTNAKVLRKTLSFLRKIFLFKICSKKKVDGKPCLNYHISRCIGPCTGKITQKEYLEIIKSVSMFLEGKVGNLLSYLKEKMDRMSELQEYEKAGKLRDQIEVIQKMTITQTVSKFGNSAQDFIGYAEDLPATDRQAGKNKALIALFKVRDGKLLAKENFNLIKKLDSKVSEALSSFIQQYYSASSPLPDEIFIPASIDEKELFQEWLKKSKGKTVKIFIPQRGYKKKLLNMASNNARYKLMEDISSKPEHSRLLRSGQVNLLIDLKERLGLSSIPFRIEGIDISNIRGKNAVGSVVVFEKGYPKKNEWRKFRIKSVATINDYMMMKEVVERRYRRILEEKTKLPDLVLVDGGVGQVSVTKHVFDGLDRKNIPIIGIAKPVRKGLLTRSRGENKIHLSYSSKTISLNPRIASFRFLAQVRDEAHRFAHSYYQILKKREIKG